MIASNNVLLQLFVYINSIFRKDIWISLLFGLKVRFQIFTIVRFFRKFFCCDRFFKSRKEFFRFLRDLSGSGSTKQTISEFLRK